MRICARFAAALLAALALPATADGPAATAFLGGSWNPRLPGWPDERIAALAEPEFGRITGTRATTIEVSRPEIPAYDLSWAALDDLRLPTGVHLCAGYIERAGVTGRLVRARRLVRKLVEEEA